MKEINIVYSKNAILTDENNHIITKAMLEQYKECNNLISFLLLYESPEDYLTILQQWDQKDFMLHKLLSAYYLKKALPHMTIRFSNTDSYYNLPIDNNGLSILDDNFVLSDYAFTGLEKSVRIMFDYCSSGVWNSDGHEVVIDMLPCSQTTKDYLVSFAKGLDSMRIPYDDDFTKEEENQSDGYMDLGLKGAIALKKELSDWKVTFYNYGQYYDLPIDEHNESEILENMDVNQIKRNNVKLP